ncbi:DUF922 domain-containing protein [Maribacter sp. 2304DJ31-5]|uniref:DUF922 domain-containing protein n=1 Tax=Maribacter sp. 2304DJ31-5 TaxID=3386273 RepID=UPI0039BC306D
MDIIRSFLIVVFLFQGSALSVFGQEEVLWKADKRLYWKDFKGKVPIGASAAAVTASGINYQFSAYYENNEMKVDYEVQAFFYPTKSWYRPKICNEITLAHERLHFDITELFARKMRMEMAKTQFAKNSKAKVKSLYKSILKALNDYQNEYDMETDFSRNLEKQKAWTAKIKKALNN